jgi:hypothetical protein
MHTYARNRYQPVDEDDEEDSLEEVRAHVAARHDRMHALPGGNIEGVFEQSDVEEDEKGTGVHYDDAAGVEEEEEEEEAEIGWIHGGGRRRGRDGAGAGARQHNARQRAQQRNRNGGGTFYDDEALDEDEDESDEENEENEEEEEGGGSGTSSSEIVLDERLAVGVKVRVVWEGEGFLATITRVRRTTGTYDVKYATDGETGTYGGSFLENRWGCPRGMLLDLTPAGVKVNTRMCDLIPFIAIFSSRILYRYHHMSFHNTAGI